MNKKILVILGISLALNFLLIGFQIAQKIYQPPFPPPERMRFAAGPHMKDNGHMDPFKQAFKQAFATHREAMEASKKSIAEAVKADNFDTVILKQAFENASDLRKNMDEQVQVNMIEIIGKMTPAERKQFAEAFERGPHFMKDKRSFAHNRFLRGREHAGTPGEVMPPPPFEAAPQLDENGSVMPPPCPCPKMQMPCQCAKMQRGKCNCPDMRRRPCNCPNMQNNDPMSQHRRMPGPHQGN